LRDDIAMMIFLKVTDHLLSGSFTVSQFAIWHAGGLPLTISPSYSPNIPSGKRTLPQRQNPWNESGDPTDGTGRKSRSKPVKLFRVADFIAGRTVATGLNSLVFTAYSIDSFISEMTSGGQSPSSERGFVHILSLVARAFLQRLDQTVLLDGECGESALGDDSRFVRNWWRRRSAESCLHGAEERPDRYRRGRVGRSGAPGGSRADLCAAGHLRHFERRLSGTKQGSWCETKKAEHFRS
jgi:hypothetical protein